MILPSSERYTVRVGDVMTRDAVFVPPETTLMAASEMMRLLNVGHLPVVDGERVVGLVSDRDIIVRGLALGFDPRLTRVSQVMARHIPQCAPEEDVEDVAERLQQLQVRRLLVLDGRERLLGSVGLAELLQAPRGAREEDEDIFVRPRA